MNSDTQKEQEGIALGESEVRWMVTKTELALKGDLPGNLSYVKMREEEVEENQET